VVVVAGLLGAGKTTLIVEAARRLVGQGLRVAVITNDQGSGLVDTSLMRVARIPVAEVAGGCFCCRFSDFLEQALTLRAGAADVIFAEPVGSCLDVAATVIRPLLRDEPHRFRVAPLTVLVDPARARAVCNVTHDDLAYLFHHQVAEADIVCLSKADRPSDPTTFDGVAVHRVSARSGEGVDAWLGYVLGGEGTLSGRQLTVDYRRYADAEAALGWLNWHVQIDLPTPLSPALVVGPFVDRLDAALTERGVRLVHLKVLDQSPAGYVRLSLCANGEEPILEGALDAAPTRAHELLINARALGDPDVLSETVAEALDAIRADVMILRREAFRPAEPRPERRA
jgi:hypothetical protein